MTNRTYPEPEPLASRCYHRSNRGLSIQIDANRGVTARDIKTDNTITLTHKHESNLFYQMIYNYDTETRTKVFTDHEIIKALMIERELDNLFNN